MATWMLCKKNNNNNVLIIENSVKKAYVSKQEKNAVLLKISAATKFDNLIIQGHTILSVSIFLVVVFALNLMKFKF